MLDLERRLAEPGARIVHDALRRFRETAEQLHQPFAVYCPEVEKTFFCYGGTSKESDRRLWHMVSYFDHRTGTVPRPTILLDKKTDDAHDNPVIAVDDQGHLWAGGRYGLLHHDGTTWSHIPVRSESAEPDPEAPPSLPITEIRDIEVDGAGRVWILGPDRVLLLTR